MKDTNSASSKDTPQNLCKKSSLQLITRDQHNSPLSEGIAKKVEITNNGGNVDSVQSNSDADNRNEMYSASYVDVKTPPTPPTTSELASASDDSFKCLPADISSHLISNSNMFHSPTSSALYYQQLNNNASLRLCSSPYNSHNSLPGDMCATLNQFQYRYPVQITERFPCRKRSSTIENNATATLAQQECGQNATNVVTKMESKPKAKRRKRRTNAATPSSTPETNISSEGRSNQQNSRPGSTLFLLDSPLERFRMEQQNSNDNTNSGRISPISKRGSNRSINGTPTPMISQIARGEINTMNAAHRSSTPIGNNFSNYQQHQVFVFSSKLANQAAESVRTGRFASIIDFHKALPATSRLLACLQTNQQNSQLADQQMYAVPTTPLAASNSPVVVSAVKDNLTPEQLKKRQENLAKLQGIGELLNVYPSSSSVQDVITRNSSQSVRNSPSCSISPSPYRFTNSASDMLGARRNVMITPNGQMVTVNDASTLGHPLNRRLTPVMYGDPYLECPPSVISCPPTPSMNSCHPTSAQLDWQRLQAEFFEKRAKEQQMNIIRMQNGGMSDSPFYSGSNPGNNNGQMACIRRNMMLMRAGHPERFSSAVDFLRRTGCPPNAFNTGCEMQMCPSPKEMNYEIDGQELIITKQPNRLGANRSNSCGNAVSTSNSSIMLNGELAPPLSSMLEMTNSIPQPSTSPSNSSHHANFQSNGIGDHRIIEENRNSSASVNASNITKSSKTIEGILSPAIASVQPKAIHHRSCAADQIAFTGNSYNNCSHVEQNISQDCLRSSSIQQQAELLSNYDHPSIPNKLMQANGLFKMQPNYTSNVRHYYPANPMQNNVCYFDDFSNNGSTNRHNQHHMQPMDPNSIMTNNQVASQQQQTQNGVCHPTMIHNGHGPPSVNNTYVNATMSIQQLNIQSVQPPGPQTIHHPVGNQHVPANIYSQQNPHTGGVHHPHHPHHLSPHSAQYINTVQQGTPMAYNPSFDEINAPQSIISVQPSMMNNSAVQHMNPQHPQMIVMRTQQPGHHHMSANRMIIQPRIAAAAMRYESTLPNNYSGLPFNKVQHSAQAMMVSQKPDYPKMANLTTQQIPNEIQYGGYNTNYTGSMMMMPSQGISLHNHANKKINMSNATMLAMQNDYNRGDRVMMMQQHQIRNNSNSVPTVYNSQFMMASDNNAFDHINNTLTTAVGNGCNNMMRNFKAPQNTTSSVMMTNDCLSSMDANNHDFDTMDKVSARLAEAGMMFTSDPLLETTHLMNNPTAIDNPYDSLESHCLPSLEASQQEQKQITNQILPDNKPLLSGQQKQPPSTNTVCKDEI